jgi:restriction endonuclease
MLPILTRTTILEDRGKLETIPATNPWKNAPTFTTQLFIPKLGNKSGQNVRVYGHTAKNCTSNTSEKTVFVQAAQGPKEKSVTVKSGADLYTPSNERTCYQDGFVVAEISAEPGNEYLRSNNGQVRQLGEEVGGLREDVWRVQIKKTIEKHLDNELQVRARGSRC